MAFHLYCSHLWSDLYHIWITITISETFLHTFRFSLAHFIPNVADQANFPKIGLLLCFVAAHMLQLSVTYQMG